MHVSQVLHHCCQVLLFTPPTPPPPPATRACNNAVKVYDSGVWVCIEAHCAELNPVCPISKQVTQLGIGGQVDMCLAER